MVRYAQDVQEGVKTHASERVEAPAVVPAPVDVRGVPAAPVRVVEHVVQHAKVGAQDVQEDVLAAQVVLPVTVHVLMAVEDAQVAVQHAQVVLALVRGARAHV